MRLEQNPLVLVNGLDRQARCAIESARTGSFQAQTLGNCSNALRLASATIKALLSQIPNYDQEPTKSIIFELMCAELKPE